MEWMLKKFNDFSVTELYNVLKLRANVFVVEQECAYPELDDKDQTAIHLLAREDDATLIAYLRILPRGLTFDEVSIGRVVVTKNSRGKGIARELVQRAIAFIQEEWQEKQIKIEAEYYLREFYESLGFQRVSDPYLEDGIKHIEMLLEM